MEQSKAILILIIHAAIPQFAFILCPADIYVSVCTTSFESFLSQLAMLQLLFLAIIFSPKFFPEMKPLNIPNCYIRLTSTKWT